MMVRPRPRQASTASSNDRFRSSTDIEKNSPCLPLTKMPSIPRSSVQWRTFSRKPSSSMARSSVNGMRAAAQMPVMAVRACALASLRV